MFAAQYGMDKRENPITEMRIKKLPRVSNRQRRTSASTTGISASASGTQSTGESGSSEFKPWLKDDEFEPRARVGRGRQSRTIAPSETALTSNPGAEAAQREIEKRTAMVEELQARVASGTYEIDNEALARTMLGLNKAQE